MGVTKSGLGRIEPRTVVALGACMALWASAFAGIRIGLRWMSPRRWIGASLGFGGLAAVTVGTSGGISFRPAALPILLAAAAESVYFVLQKPLLKRYPPLDLTCYTIWAGTAFMLPLAPSLVSQLRIAPPEAAIAAAYLGLFPAAAGYLLWSYALSRSEVSRLGGTLNIPPLLAPLIAFAALKEVPSALTLAGGLVTLCGIALQSRSPAAKKRRILPCGGAESDRSAPMGSYNNVSSL